MQAVISCHPIGQLAGWQLIQPIRNNHADFQNYIRTTELNKVGYCHRNHECHEHDSVFYHLSVSNTASLEHWLFLIGKVQAKMRVSHF